MAYCISQSAEPRRFPKAASLGVGERGAEHPLLPIRGVQISNSATETQRVPEECFFPALKKLHPLLGASLNVPGAEQRVREESQLKLGESVAFGYCKKNPPNHPRQGKVQ